MTHPQPAHPVDLPEPSFRLTWRDAHYWVSKPNIDSTDCYTPEDVRAAIASAVAPWREMLRELLDEIPHDFYTVPLIDRAEALLFGAVPRTTEELKALSDYYLNAQQPTREEVEAEEGSMPEQETKLLARLASAPRPMTQGEPSAVSLAVAEVEKATRKFPTWPTDPLHAVAVLGEEFGELTKAVLQLTYEPHKTTADEVRTEAIQTAAMALRFLMSLDAYEYKQGVQHAQEAL